MLTLTFVCAAGQIVSAGGMARREGFTWVESLSIGVGMMGRAEMAFVLSSLGLQMQVITSEVFSILIFTTFLLNIMTIIGLKACAIMLKKEGIAHDDQILNPQRLDDDKF